jgi:hypothetical protein
MLHDPSRPPKHWAGSLGVCMLSETLQHVEDSRDAFGLCRYLKRLHPSISVVRERFVEVSNDTHLQADNAAT